MQHAGKSGYRGRRSFDVVIFIVVAALAVMFIFEIPGIAVSRASSGQAMELLITELMPSNKGTVTTEDGRYCDWIELYNPTSRPINLAGFALTDNPKMPTKYVLPYWILGPGEYVLVYADDRPATATELHACFKLKNADEIVMLVGTDGAEIQRVNYPAMESDQSYALDMDTMEWTATDECTPGFPNTGEGYEAFRRSRRAESPVAINEVMAGNTMTLMDEDGDFSDWVELYNASEETIDLTGWGLSDIEARPKGWVFPETQIGPGEYMIIYLSGKNRAESGAELHTDFKLKNEGESVYLSNLHGQIVSEVHIDDLKEDLSYGMVPGTGRWQVYSQPTPGYPNTIDGWNAFQEDLYSGMDSPVIISEVMSCNISTLQDQYGEYPDWIELYNRSDKDVDLSGWGLTDDTTALGRWRFPPVILSAGEYLTVYASGKDTVSEEGLHTNFSLGAEGEIVVLTDPAGTVADRCCVPPLRPGLTYQRKHNLCFVYCDHPTPGEVNANGYPGMASKPFYSIQAGMYDDAQLVEVLTTDPGARIYYTLDGTTPDENAIPYTGPIRIEATTAVRTIAYRDGYLPSNAACATYLIGENIHLPVVSIVTDPANLFDKETGIYVDGPGWTEPKPHYGANYWQDWERPAHMELLEPDGTVGISQDIGIRIFGGYSRAYNKKSFSLMSRGEYGSSTFDYQVFPELPYTSYKDLIVRNGGQDYDRSLIRTELQTQLIKETSDIDIQASRQCILFINGQFWGIYGIMEKLNEHFIAQHHGVDPDKINLLEGDGRAILGSNEEYIALVEYVKAHDMSVQAHYEYVASKMDIDNYIDWCTIQMYIANRDLNNIKMWRPQTPDGKWRWILFDLDWGFYHLYQNGRKEYLDMFNSFLNPKGYGNVRADNSLVRGLLENEGFKQKFIERFVYHCTVTFAPDKVLQRIDELAANIEPYMQRNLDTWPTSRNVTMGSWKQVDLQLMKDFAVERPAINLRSMQEYFGLTDAQMAQLLDRQS